MKPGMWILFVLLSAGTLFAVTPPANKGSAGMEKMKSLEGVWEGKDAEGGPVHISYKSVSGGSSLMETMDHHDTKEAMVTMYHLDGDKLMMTHYCSMGNQPRMRMTNSSATSVAFSFIDGTNMASAKDPHMHKLVITWKDKDHIRHEWTMRSEGKNAPPVVFTLERKS